MAAAFAAYLTASSPASAALVQCPSEAHFVRFDTATGQYSEGTVNALAEGISLSSSEQNEPQIDSQNAVAHASLALAPESKTLNILAPNRAVLAKLKVSGHPLRPSAQIIGADGIARDCQFGPGDLSSFYAATVSEAVLQAGIVRWNDWKSARSAACDPALDSIGYFQPTPAGAKPKIALVFHGVGSNPRAMEPSIRLLLDAGYNVLAPRLRHHFNADLHDLDNAYYSDWIEDSDQAFALARSFVDARSGEVTLVGFSLGGFLATRLAHMNRDHVDRAVLFAPAWGVSPTVSMASIVGNLLSISLNRIMKTPEACRVNDGYVPSAAGRQVERMVLSNVYAMDPDGNYSATTTVEVPHLVVTSADDQAIDLGLVNTLCTANHIYCRHMLVHGVDHGGTSQALDTTGDADSDGHAFRGLPISRVVASFLQERI